MRLIRTLPIALVVFFVGCADWAVAADAPAAVRPIVFLERGVGCGIDINGHVDYTQIRREYLRQAFLLSAREELGWQTEDAWLGERPTKGAATQLLDVVELPGWPHTFDVLSGPPPQQRRRGNFVLPNEVTRDDGGEIAAYERLAREQFPQILRRVAGAEGVKRPGWGAAELPAGVEEQLGKMSFYSQFAAVRAIHAAIAKNGESPALIGGLIRGYANLGLLTEGLWNPSFRVYHARALLYAQRWQAHDPGGRQPLWHRAYAEAAAGFHGRAIDVLARADAIPSPAGAAASDPPPWLPLVRGYVNFDLAPLAAVKDGPQKQLASLLLFIAYQQAGTPELAIKLGSRVITAMPDCYRMHDDLARVGGVSLGHRTTDVTPAVFALTVYRNVALLDGCPDEAMDVAGPRARQDEPLDAGEILAERQERPKLIAALYQAAGATDDPPKQRDAAEPGWGALASWIDDTSFAQVFRRAEFLGRILSTDPVNYLDSITPLIEHHPYRNVIESFRFDLNAKRLEVSRLKRMSLVGLDVRQRYLFDLFMGFDRNQASEIWNTLQLQTDETANDCVVLVNAFNGDRHVQIAEQLLKLSPRSPQALAILIEERWDQYKDRADQYVALAQQHPRLARALARKYTQAMQFEKAEPLFTQAIKLDPSFDSYDALAGMYRKRGDLEKFQKTYETYLQKEPDFALNHARANNIVAWCYIRRGEWEKARPFAMHGAESGAEWALTTYAIVCERTNKFAEADAIYHAIADRYGEQESLYWFEFCRRTGHGSEAEARTRWEQYVARRMTEPDGNRSVAFGVTDLMDGKEDDALGFFQRNFEATSDPLSGLLAATVADRLGKADVRDQMLATVGERGGKFIDEINNHPRQNLIDLAALLAADLANKEHPAPDLAKLEAICKRGSGFQVHMAAYIVGEYLVRHGKAEDAQRFWLHATDEPEAGRLYFELASFRLKEAGVKPEELESRREKLGMKDRWVEN